MKHLVGNHGDENVNWELTNSLWRKLNIASPFIFDHRCGMYRHSQERIKGPTQRFLEGPRSHWIPATMLFPRPPPPSAPANDPLASFSSCHVSEIRRCMEHSERCVVSIFLWSLNVGQIWIRRRREFLTQGRKNIRRGVLDNFQSSTHLALK